LPRSVGAVTPELVATLERALHSRIVQSVAVSGGDINDAYRVELLDRRRVFVKTNPRAPSRMFETEAHGLDWLRAAKAIALPEVLAVGTSAPYGESSFLVLEWLDTGRAGPRFDEHLGQRLASLHRYGAERFGLDRDNFIGRLPQSNRRSAHFLDFFVEQRLLAQFELARKNGHFEATTRARFERFIERLGTWLSPEEPPARLHGDLWSGNHLVGPDGEPWLIDPAAYGGHREIDLAMMRLFGGFSERVFDAYSETYPLLPGHRERVHLMQLYPLLVHVNLFGGGYVASVRRIIDEYLR
jgi:fructosamine-3-kinase